MKNAYVPSSNISENSDNGFTAMVAKGNSRGRLQSVAIQPTSHFSKRLSNANDEKVITSS